MDARPSFSRTEREILDLLRGIHTTTRVTILMVTHSVQLVPYGERVLQMAGGTIVEAGRTHFASL